MLPVPGDPDDIGPIPLAAPFIVAALGLLMIVDHVGAPAFRGFFLAQLLAAPVAGMAIGRCATHPLIGPRAWRSYAFIVWLLAAGGATAVFHFVGLIEGRPVFLAVPVFGVIEGAIVAVPTFALLLPMVATARRAAGMRIGSVAHCALRRARWRIPLALLGGGGALQAHWRSLEVPSEWACGRASLMPAALVLAAASLAVMVCHDALALFRLRRSLRSLDGLRGNESDAAMATWDPTGALDLGVGEELWGMATAADSPYRAMPTRRIALRGTPRCATRILVGCVAWNALALGLLVAATLWLQRLALLWE